MLSAEIKERLFSAVDELRPQLVQTLQDLVRIPSVVGNEAQAQQYMKKLYQDLGLTVEMVEPDMEAVRQASRLHRHRGSLRGPPQRHRHPAGRTKALPQ